jgi:hypothetical protein
MIAGNEGKRSQTGVEIGVEAFNPKPAALDQRRNLIVVVGSGNRAALQPLRRVANPSMTAAKPSSSARRSDIVTSALSFGVDPMRGGVG